jgi:hypothetical protein
MAYTQLVEPDLSVHDNPGWCLDMIEKCFGTPRFHPSATSAWLDTQYKHYERDMPNVAVPVWFSWVGDLGDGQGRIDWGHVVAWIPSEGKFLSSPKNWNEGDTSDWYGSIEEVERWLGASYFGWSEDLNGMQIVSGSAEPAAPLAGNQRRAGSKGVFRRAEPNQASEHLQPDLEAGDIGNFNGWIHGEDRGGNDVWFQGVSGNWFWSGAFEDPSTDGINDLNPAAAPATPAEPEPAPVMPEEAAPATPDAPPAPVDEPVTPAIDTPAVVDPTPAPVKEEKIVTAEEIQKEKDALAALPAADLGVIIPSAKGRKIAYAGYALLALIVGNVGVGFAAAGIGWPVWLVVSVAIVNNLALPFGALALANASNTSK